MWNFRRRTFTSEDLAAFGNETTRQKWAVVEFSDCGLQCVTGPAILSFVPSAASLMSDLDVHLASFKFSSYPIPPSQGSGKKYLKTLLSYLSCAAITKGPNSFHNSVCNSCFGTASLLALATVKSTELKDPVQLLGSFTLRALSRFWNVSKHVHGTGLDS